MLKKQQKFLLGECDTTDGPEMVNQDDNYSADDFESDGSEQPQVQPSSQNEFDPSLSLNTKSAVDHIETSIVLQSSKKSDDLSLHDTSRFGMTQLSEKTFDPLADFRNNPTPSPTREQFEPRERGKWDRQSFGLDEVSLPQQPLQDTAKSNSPLEAVVVDRKAMPKAVVMDFNEEMDAGKLKKFEEFKAR